MAGYKALEHQGILPKWPGSGYLFKYSVPPTNKSDKDKSAWKTPMFYILDSNVQNPLNCTNTFKRIAAFFCKNCPSANGLLGIDRHLGNSYFIIKLFDYFTFLLFGYILFILYVLNSTLMNSDYHYKTNSACQVFAAFNYANHLANLCLSLSMKLQEPRNDAVLGGFNNVKNENHTNYIV